MTPRPPLLAVVTLEADTSPSATIPEPRFPLATDDSSTSTLPSLAA